jgi:hypothetical protein
VSSFIAAGGSAYHFKNTACSFCKKKSIQPSIKQKFTITPITSSLDKTPIHTDSQTAIPMDV